MPLAGAPQPASWEFGSSKCPHVPQAWHSGWLNNTQKTEVA